VELSCQQIQEILSSQLDGESTLQEDKIAEAHLTQCTKCSDFADQMENLSFVMLRDMEVVETDETVQPPKLDWSDAKSKESGYFDPKLFVLLILPALQFMYHLAPGSVVFGPAALLATIAAWLSWKTESQKTFEVEGKGLLVLILVPALGLTASVVATLSTCLWLLHRGKASFQGLLTAVVFSGVSLEILTRQQDNLSRVLVIATEQNTTAWLCWSIGFLLGGTWTILMTRLWPVTLALWVAGSATGYLFLSPLVSAYCDYTAQVAQLPEPRRQRWRICLSSISVVDIETRQIERWNAMQQAPKTYTVSGKLWSAFHVMDGRRLLLGPWPGDLSPRLQSDSVQDIQSSVAAEFARLDREIERRLSGSFEDFLLYTVDPRPVAPVFALKKDQFEVKVPGGAYLLAFEQIEREQQMWTPGWDQILVKADVRLDEEKGYYTPDFIWSEPRNLKLTDGLDGWSHNGKTRPLKPGAAIEKMVYPDTPHSMDQNFMIGALGARRGDEIRFRALTANDYEHAVLELWTSGFSGGSKDYQRASGTKGKEVSLTVPVTEQTESVGMRFGHRKIGEDILVRGFVVEVIRDGAVVTSVGLQQP
jgi:putative zinc finger protein